MKKHVRTFLAAAALCFVGVAAQAQYSLRILQPASVAGTVPGTTPPSATWGFGDPNLVVPVTGLCQWAQPDSFVIGTPGGVGNLTGKIALVRRGPAPPATNASEFGTKALACQTAGAIAVIIVDNLGRALPNPIGPGADGVNVTIPIIGVEDIFQRTYGDLVTAGTLQVSIGNFRGQLSNNLAVPFDQTSVPFAFAYPAHMLQDSGIFVFPIVGNAVNVGNQAQTSPMFKRQVVRVSPNPQVLFSDSNQLVSLSPNDTSHQNNAVMFDLVAADPTAVRLPAHYQLIYSVSQAGVVDNDPSDNTRTYDFYITDSAFSKSRLNASVAPTDPAYLRPISGPAYTVAGGGALRWGHLLKTGPFTSTAAKVKSITFAATTNTADSLSGESMEVDLFKWDDADLNNVIIESEVTLLGSGFHEFLSNSERSKFITQPITDATTGEDGVILQPDSRYITCINYGGTVSVFIEADENVWDYDSNFVFSNGEPQLPLFNGTDWSTFVRSIQPALRTDIIPWVVADKPTLLNATYMSVHPNPAQSMVQVSVGDKTGAGSATITIRDLSGRQVYQSRQPLQGTASAFKISVETLPAGLYNVTASTGNGAKTQKLVITR